MVLDFLEGRAELRGLAREHNLSRHLIRLWIQKYEAGQRNDEVADATRIAQHETKIAELERKVGQLTMEVELLKKRGSLGTPAERREFLHRERTPTISIARGCRVMKLARSTYYYRSSPLRSGEKSPAPADRRAQRGVSALRLSAHDSPAAGRGTIGQSQGGGAHHARKWASGAAFTVDSCTPPRAIMKVRSFPTWRRVSFRPDPTKCGIRSDLLRDRGRLRLCCRDLRRLVALGGRLRDIAAHRYPVGVGGVTGRD